jgi:hypothetical protein
MPKDAGYVQQLVRAEGENDARKDARQQGANASANTAWMLRIVHGHFPAMTFSSLSSWLS